jgi:cbb3-type cytochrome oxidase subunit 3
MLATLLVAICLGLTYISSRNSYWILKVFAGFFWLGLMFYWVKNPVSDSNLQTIVIMLCLGIGIACCFWAFWQTNKDQRTGFERGKFRMPFMRDEDEDAGANLPTRNERINAYYKRTEDAMNGRRQRRG